MDRSRKRLQMTWKAGVTSVVLPIKITSFFAEKNMGESDWFSFSNPVAFRVTAWL